MPSIFGHEPVFWVGVVTACVIAVIQTLGGQGVITANQQDTIANLVTAISPIVAALVARQFVTPVAKS